MDPFRGKLLDPQGRTRFEDLDISIVARTAPGGVEEWTGYFEPPPASSLIAGGTFRLVLEDGRARDIEIKGVEAGSHGHPRVRF
jgi:hypothetical protein